MELKTSVWSNFFKELSPEGRLEEFSRAGFKYLEFSTEDGEGYYDQHYIPFFGRSAIPWVEFMKALGSSEYSGLFNFEIPGVTGNAPIEALRLKLAYIQGLASYMQSLTLCAQQSQKG